MKSTVQKIQQCEGLLGTEDLNEWQEKFIRSLCNAVREDKNHSFSDKQLEKLEEIYERNFAS